jgi:hypothetical protein
MQYYAVPAGLTLSAWLNDLGIRVYRVMMMMMTMVTMNMSFWRALLQVRG